MPDLWPDDIGQLEVRTPAIILEEQANFLSRKTNNLIEAKVKAYGVVSKEFIYSFSILAKTLSNYTFTLFYLYHSIDFFPVRIQLEYEIPVDPFINLRQLRTEEELTGALSFIFTSEKVRKLLNSLISEAKRDTTERGLV